MTDHTDPIWVTGRALVCDGIGVPEYLVCLERLGDLPDSGHAVRTALGRLRSLERVRPLDYVLDRHTMWNITHPNLRRFLGWQWPPT